MSDAGAVLIFGASGQLGARLTHAFAQAGYEVTALARADCDFATVERKRIETAIRAVEPVLIFNAAAYTAVDKAESEQAVALRVNAEVPGWIAECAAAQGAKFVHFSTDYVFDGVRGRYAEDATVNPINAYGASKLGGEQAVLAHGAYVFRLQWLYDTHGHNFFLTMKKLLSERPELRVVADQLGAPTPVRDIAHAMVQLAPKLISGEVAPRLFHLAAGGYTSWHGFACAIAEAMGSTSRIIPITTEEYPLPAARPLDGRLNCHALAEIGVVLPHWRDALAALWREDT